MKAYVKPELFYEDFELSHTIANCSPALNHSQSGCNYDDPTFGNIFTSACANDGTVLEIFCYWNGDTGYNLFTS